jgi:hypothetical protein
MGGTLGLVNAKDSTWSEGIAQAYAGSVFVAPPLGSWTLAVGLPLAPADDTEGSVRPALEELGRRFGEAQYFSTHRVSEFHVWARAVGGKLVRAYGYVGDSGETYGISGRRQRRRSDSASTSSTKPRLSQSRMGISIGRTCVTPGRRT